MRYKVSLDIRLRGSDWDTRDTFWKAFPHPHRVGEQEISESEGLLKTKFPYHLQNLLKDNCDTVTVLVTSISYHSLHLGIDVITGAISAAGLTTEDLLSALMQFTPVALEETFPGRGVGNFVVRATGTAVDASAESPPAAPTAPAAPAQTGGRNVRSRLSDAWWIANTSLVGTALLLAGAAAFAFQAAQEDKKSVLEAARDERSRLTQALVDDRDRLTKALLQEQTDLRSGQQKLTDGLAAQVKAIQEHLAAEAQHFQELQKLETDLMKARLGPSTELSHPLIS
jgi:hypothetical protein